MGTPACAGLSQRGGVDVAPGGQFGEKCLPKCLPRFQPVANTLGGRKTIGSNMLHSSWRCDCPPAARCHRPRARLSTPRLPIETIPTLPAYPAIPRLTPADGRWPSSPSWHTRTGLRVTAERWERVNSKGVKVTDG